MGERAWAGTKEELISLVEKSISKRNEPKKFDGKPYYYVTAYLGESRAQIVAEMIRYHGYLVRLDMNKNFVWHIYVRRK